MAGQHDVKRILIIRTDRIGDAVLTTPVIEAMRQAYPGAHIAVMIQGYVKDVIVNNPYLNEVIIYKKKDVESGLGGFLKFAWKIRQKKFDLVFVLHPTTPAHLLSFFAGIPRRVGYDRKFPFFLTDKIPHTKQLGQRHEVEYCLDLVRHMGIVPAHHGPYVPLNQEAEAWAETLFREQGITPQDRIVVLHPGTSCPSKMWPQERFAAVAEELVKLHGFTRVIILGGPEEKEITGNVLRHMTFPVLDLTGITIAQDISILKRSHFLVTTDCGTMHIGAALGIPLVVVFGRKQAGISPVRFGPVSKRARVMHKDVGCAVCLAHDCTLKFACLTAVSVKEVVDAARDLMESSHA